ncbi:hypothetical protein IR094_004290 [Streptococcus danieliae]
MKLRLFFGYNQSIDEGRITILAESLEIIKQQASTIQSLTEENSLLREQVAYLTQKLYGKSSEKKKYCATWPNESFRRRGNT